MPLIKSISGIRGTLGDIQGENLTKEDVVKFATAFAFFIKEKKWGDKLIIGRDARPSGSEFANIISTVFVSLGFTVIDLGLATTPTVEIAVLNEKAAGAIIITASHNPIEWNALKLLNNEGEFLSKSDGLRVLALAEDNSNSENNLLSGELINNDVYLQKHLDAILALPLVDRAGITGAKLKIAIDGINSVGGPAVIALLKNLRIADIIELNCLPDGKFAHNPEPLENNLVDLQDLVKLSKADLGIAVDPDVDRLAFVSEDGSFFGEEYTLVAVSDYVLANYQGNKYQKNTVSNLSSSRALRDITNEYGGQHYPAAVGEVNVVDKMKSVSAVIGGEGNGGVIFPELHYGRDALVGIALFLSALVKSKQKMSEFRNKFPKYLMIKEKIILKPGANIQEMLTVIKSSYPADLITDIDGVKIDWPDAWLHLRASNTEPIVRLYGESLSAETLSKYKEDLRSKILAYIQ